MVVSLIALVVALSGTAMAAATLVNGDKLIKKRTLSGNRLRKHTITGKEIDLTKVNVPRTCENGSVAAVASWYTDAGRPPTGFPMDPNFTAPNQFGGEGGFACNGATPLLAKEGKGAYRMEFSQELPNKASYLAFVNPDARSQTPVYAQSNFELAANGRSAWDIYIFDKNGNPADPYYLEVMLVKLS